MEIINVPETVCKTCKHYTDCTNNADCLDCHCLKCRYAECNLQVKQFDKLWESILEDIPEPTCNSCEFLEITDTECINIDCEECPCNQCTIGTCGRPRLSLTMNWKYKER